MQIIKKLLSIVSFLLSYDLYRQIANLQLKVS